MSWDVLLTVVPDGVDSTEQLPSGFRRPPVGGHAEVEEGLRRAVSGIDLTDPAWGVVDGPGWVVEVNIGRSDPVEAIMLHIRGGGDDVLPVVFRMAGELGCRLVDVVTGELLSDGAVLREEDRFL